jgi:hypothetical protein
MRVQKARQQRFILVGHRFPAVSLGHSLHRQPAPFRALFHLVKQVQHSKPIDTLATTWSAKRKMMPVNGSLAALRQSVAPICGGARSISGSGRQRRQSAGSAADVGKSGNSRTSRATDVKLSKCSRPHFHGLCDAGSRCVLQATTLGRLTSPLAARALLVYRMSYPPSAALR